MEIADRHGNDHTAMHKYVIIFYQPEIKYILFEFIIVMQMND